jgi:Uma2 family endonuclease
MPRVRSPFPKDATLADALKQLGDIPPRRVRLNPFPGTATERDLLAVLDHTNRPCELVDRTLVEKPMGFLESHLAGVIIRLLGNFVESHDLGIVTAPDGILRLMPGLVRVPDAAFVSWKQLPNRKCPHQPIPQLIPELAVEVLSDSNTPAEMERKLKEYFLAGSQLVWLINPDTRSVDVHTAPDCFVCLHEGDILDGGTVLPGFRLPLEQLFARVEKRPPRRRGSKRRRDGN